MSDNVLILGAGFSFDAGVPLLGNFVDQMIDIALRGTFQGQPIDSEDLALIREAMEIRGEMDGYHGRAVFDDRNIEDILSILSFNVLGGTRTDQNKLTTMSKAIAATINICCRVRSPYTPDFQSIVAIDEDPGVYRSFWKGLFEWSSKGNEIPTIITFNYDLVLELSFLQTLNNTLYDGYNSRVPFSSIEVRYHHFDELDAGFTVATTNYDMVNQRPGTKLIPFGLDGGSASQIVDILKLHGSLNFPKKKPGLVVRKEFKPVENPDIVPPISNKASQSGAQKKVWRTALNRLRVARNVVFVGYSLPRTDMYMQYFLKAAFGPNQGLSRITVFDPALGNEFGREMADRYESCFSQQMRKRITFKASDTKSFVDQLFANPEELFF